MNRFELKQKSKSQISGKLGILFLCLFVVAAIETILAIIPILGWIGSLLLMPPLTVGFYGIYLNLVKDVYPEVKDLFKYINRFLKALGLNILVELIVIAGTILLIVPGIIFAMALSQANYIFADNPDMKITDIISTSMSMMKGHKWEFFVLQLSFLGWVILGVFTLYILTFVYVIPYYMTTNTNYYLELKNEYLNNLSGAGTEMNYSSSETTSNTTNDTPWEIK